MFGRKKSNRLGGDIANVTLSKLLLTGISMVTGMLLSRFRTLTEYGTYSQLILVINLANALFMLGLPNSLNYFLARSDSAQERRNFLSVYYSISTVLGFIIGAILLMSVPLLVKYFDNPLLGCFAYFLAVYPWTQIIASGMENVLIVYQRTGMIVAFRLANNAAVLSCVLLVQALHWDFTSYMIMYLVVEVVFALAVYVIAVRLANGLRFQIKLSMARKIFAFSVPLGLASMVGTLNIEIDKLMISSYLDTQQLAIYTNAAREMPVTMVAASVTAVLMPQLVRLIKANRQRETIELWGHANKLSFSILCFFAAALFVFAPEVVTLLYSEKYLPGVDIFRVYSLVLLTRFTYWGMILNAMGKTKFILYSSIASLLINIVLNYSLFVLLGMIGPAVATLLSIGIVAFAQLLCTSGLLGTDIAHVFPWRSMLRTLALQGCIGAAMYCLKRLLPADAYLMELFNLDSGSANVIEAILLGLVWTVLYIFIERRQLKDNWRKLNGAEQRFDDEVTGHAAED